MDWKQLCGHMMHRTHPADKKISLIGEKKKVHSALLAVLKIMSASFEVEGEGPIELV